METNKRGDNRHDIEFANPNSIIDTIQVETQVKRELSE